MVPVPLFKLRSRIASGERVQLVTYLMLRFTLGYFPSTIMSATLWICRCDNKASGCSGKKVREQNEKQEDEQEEAAEAPPPPPPPPPPPSTTVLFRCYRLSCSSCQVPRKIGLDLCNWARRCIARLNRRARCASWVLLGQPGGCGVHRLAYVLRRGERKREKKTKIRASWHSARRSSVRHRATTLDFVHWNPNTGVVRAGRTVDSTIRCCEHNINPAEVYRDERRTPKFRAHCTFILIISFTFFNCSFSALWNNKLDRQISLRISRYTHIFL
ncbi:hypothetical protein ALC56_09271 [Trachymyrmex septentrionalis]|uniref:Uncharacterized protein n=1 Tax=Trachymyrmex septentrionalis TaxID=34720 RepID=A0A195F7F0_9HYME|nr:hypothetical protein ALC56_09271 [Trachymyrmex septentrionalis]